MATGLSSTHSTHTEPPAPQLDEQTGGRGDTDRLRDGRVVRGRHTRRQAVTTCLGSVPCYPLWVAAPPPVGRPLPRTASGFATDGVPGVLPGGEVSKAGASTICFAFLGGEVSRAGASTTCSVGPSRPSARSMMASTSSCRRVKARSTKAFSPDGMPRVLVGAARSAAAITPRSTLRRALPAWKRLSSIRRGNAAKNLIVVDQ